MATVENFWEVLLLEGNGNLGWMWEIPTLILEINGNQRSRWEIPTLILENIGNLGSRWEIPALLLELHLKVSRRTWTTALKMGSRE